MHHWYPLPTIHRLATLGRSRKASRDPVEIRAMTRSRGALVMVSIAVTVLALAIAVIGWGGNGLQVANAIAGVLSLTVAVIMAIRSKSEPEPHVGRRYWNPPRTRSGAGVVLLLGGVGAGLMLVAILGTVALLVR